MAQRLPSIKDLVDQELLSGFETQYIQLKNGQKRLAFIMERGDVYHFYQGGQYVTDDVIEHLEAVRKYTAIQQVSSAVSTIATQATINTLAGVNVEVTRQLSHGLFQLGELLEDAMSPKTYRSIFKQLNVLGEAVLDSTDDNAGRWWVEEHGVRPGSRYTGYLFGNRNVVTGIISGGGKGFQWPDVGILDRKVQHWRVIEFGNKDERMMPKGFIYPHNPKDSKFTNSQFTFRSPKVTEVSGKGGAASRPVWTGPLGFRVSDAEETADQIAERAQESGGMMVKNRPKHLFATVHKRALIDDKLFGLFEDITEMAYNKAMQEQASDADILSLQEIENKIKQRITL